MEAYSLVLHGVRFMPWQRMLADISLEHDPDTGLLMYDTAILVVPRQQGKTHFLEAKQTWSSRRAPDRLVVNAAQDRQMARLRLLDEYERKRLARSPLLRTRYTPVRSNGRECIQWNDLGSRIVIIANTADAGHGVTADEANLDEAFAQTDMTVVTALEPTMLTRPDPQMWIVSTVGDGTDGLLQHYQEVGVTSLTDPDTRVAYFEWSALDDDDREDPAVWRRVMPALGRTISEDRIARRCKTTPAAEFDRSYLCRRPNAVLAAKLPAADWWQAGQYGSVMPSPPYVAAVHVNPDRTHTSIAVAGHGRDARVAVVVDRRPGTGWAATALAELTRRGSMVAVHGDRRAGVGGIMDAARLQGVPIDELGATDVADMCGAFYDLVTHHQLEIDPSQQDLELAGRMAVDRPLGEAWAWAALLSPVPIDPLIAATFAAAGHRRRFPTGLKLGPIR